MNILLFVFEITLRIALKNSRKYIAINNMFVSMSCIGPKVVAFTISLQFSQAKTFKAQQASKKHHHQHHHHHEYQKPAANKQRYK